MNSFLGEHPIDIESINIRHNRPKPARAICVLLYGDNLALAQRCLNSILSLPTEKPIDLRIGMNEVSAEVGAWVKSLFDDSNINSMNRHISLFQSTKNIGKYPMMRWMFHNPANPISTPHVQWFDDDSYIKTPTEPWLQEIDLKMQQAAMCGCVMSCPLTGNQHIWIQMQPWYNGISIAKSVRCAEEGPRYYIPKFAVGGWWTIRKDVINILDWPTPNIIHRGGDYMLGEALRQRRLVLLDFWDGVAINADENGYNHKAKRRGLDPVPVGVEYDPPVTALLHEATKSIEPRLLDYPGL
jgi:hypothetical protein